MKQGMVHKSDGGRKIEPRSKAVNLSAVADEGVHQVRTKSEKLYAGRGFEAPMAGKTIHHNGSQGKH